MKICSKCGVKKEDSDFFIKDKETGRLHAQCKACYKTHRANYYSAHYEKFHQQYLDRARLQRARKRASFRDHMLDYLKDKSCSICGETDIRTFEFDHLNPSEKTFNISQGARLGLSWDEVLAEISKCRILCANCHKKHTAEQVGWYKSIL